MTSAADELAALKSDLASAQASINQLTEQRMSADFAALPQIQRDAITNNLRSLSQYASGLTERIAFLQTQVTQPDNTSPADAEPAPTQSSTTTPEVTQPPLDADPTAQPAKEGE